MATIYKHEEWGNGHITYDTSEFTDVMLTKMGATAWALGIISVLFGLFCLIGWLFYPGQ